jgi:Na+:H+ antiporter, NhaA family
VATTGGSDGLRATWARSERRVPRLVLRPLKAFLETETSGGIILLLAALSALVWANSPWAGSYDRLWHTELTLRLGGWSISGDLRRWINDALMAIFFFVVGLEIKRELVAGELRAPKVAALPVVGALGGMVAPALIFLAFNAGGATSRGWGIPMATDIAFAVGVLALAGKRAPHSLRLFLLSLAIVDDIGAILIVAIFYTADVSSAALASAGALLVLIVAFRRMQVRAAPVYLLLSVGVWLSVFESGVHASIAGVALGLLTPASPFQRPAAVSEQARETAAQTADEPEPPDADAHHWLGLARLSREAVSPLARQEHLLHPWTSFVVVPLFALANAGVSLKGGVLGESLGSRVALGIIVGLVAGKTLGIAAAAWLGARTGLARLPQGVGWPHLIAVSAVAGIGFTVSLFIAGLAFIEDTVLDAAKIGVLTGSLLAGLLGFTLLSMVNRGLGSVPPDSSAPADEEV